MAGGVDEVDEEAVAVLLTLLLDEGQIGVRHLEVHGDGGGLDGDAALLLVLAGVGGPRLAGLGRGDDAGLGQERVRQGGLAVVHVGDHGHVADVVLLVHDPTDLVDREIHLEDAKKYMRNCTVPSLSGMYSSFVLIINLASLLPCFKLFVPFRNYKRLPRRRELNCLTAQLPS